VRPGLEEDRVGHGQRPEPERVHGRHADHFGIFVDELGDVVLVGDHDLVFGIVLEE
jgi:hypothetical protein